MNYSNTSGNSQSIGGVPIAPPANFAVSNAYHRLQSAVSSLHGAIGDITGRISPILAPEPDQRQGLNEAVPSAMTGVSMADAFTDQAAMIEHAVTRLNILFQRVEL